MTGFAGAHPDEAKQVMRIAHGQTPGGAVGGIVLSR